MLYFIVIQNFPNFIVVHILITIMSRYKGVGGREKNKSGRNLPPTSPHKMKESTIPHAPTGRRIAPIAEKDFNSWRGLLDEQYPLMSPEEISRW